MRLASLSLLLLLFAAGLSACAISDEIRSSQEADVITYEEVRESLGYSTAYYLVQNLRPRWLRKRGRGSVYFEDDIQVYVNGARFGPAEVLHELSIGELHSLRYLNASEASNRYGLNHTHGAIEVTLRTD